MAKQTTIETKADDHAVSEANRVVGRLKLYFAILSCLGGLVLSAGSGTETIPVIAVFFAIFGYLFVDCFKLFALPPIAAYAAMAVAALYCVSDFADLDEPGNHQMIAVAQLLVFVQAILMLQKKSRRIFEQLGVFCLLELIVAAVFNNAINYGLLLIPIGIVGAFALSLLAVLSASEGLGILDDLESDDDPVSFLRRREQASRISFSAPESAHSLSSAALRLPRVALLTLAPSVMLVGAIFFYALPRTTDAARVQNRGNALVGFSDQLRLEQIGEMLQSTQVALRLYLKDVRTGQPYVLNNGVYLRGAVLERYQRRIFGERNSATWRKAPGSIVRTSRRLPGEFRPTRSADKNFFDSVEASVVCESMRSKSLFAVAPYHRIGNATDTIHSSDRWTLARSTGDDSSYPRLPYVFGTHAFHRGEQTELVTRSEVLDIADGSDDSSESPYGTNGRWVFNENKRKIEYREQVSEFDIESMPTISAVAKSLVNRPGGMRRTDYQIAKAMERYLSASADFSYTLDLSAPSIPGMDPIEQFMSVDRTGHCQYFASALVMMLRSQGIPARIVVGYRTDEFNELGNHYVARQLHAHSWVEALIDREQLNLNRNVYGQPKSPQYWLRLDPTPAGGLRRGAAGGVTQMLDVAQNIWDDYVLDMDGGRQDNVLVGGGLSPMNQSYERMVDWLSLSISRIRAGELGGGSLASRRLFSWPAAVLGVVMAIAAMMLFRVRFPAWVLSRLEKKGSSQVARPRIHFYAQTLDQLARVGLRRAKAQTPAELADTASASLQHPMIPPVTQPLETLTSAFYRLRYGSAAREGAEDLAMTEPIEHAREPGPEVAEALAVLTSSVDMMLAQSKQAESTT